MGPAHETVPDHADAKRFAICHFCHFEGKNSPRRHRDHGESSIDEGTWYFNFPSSKQHHDKCLSQSTSRLFLLRALCVSVIILSNHVRFARRPSYPKYHSRFAASSTFHWGTCSRPSRCA